MEDQNIPARYKAKFDCDIQLKDKEDNDKPSKKDVTRGKTRLGVAIALFPCLYVIIAALQGSAFLFDNKGGLTIFLEPIANSLIFWTCALPITVYFYKRMAQKRWPLITALVLNIAVTTFYFLGILVYSRIAFLLVWGIFGPM